MVELAAYDPRWAELFLAEADGIGEALGPLLVQLEHVGSTAVPGLAAMPTVDIAAGVTDMPIPDSATAAMVRLGFEDAAEDSRPGERRFRRGATFPRDVIVHVVEWGSPAWAGYVRFRDALRADPALAGEYEQLKRSLLEQVGGWYRGEHKRALIERTLRSLPAAAWILSGSANETEEIAARLARELEPGDLVTVSGELGSGKTTFVRGACRALGVTAPVTSPTYTIGHRYGGDPDVSHLDLYRFSGVTQAEWGDLEPYFEDAVAFVEWPEAAGAGLPEIRVAASLAHVDAHRRRIRLDASDAALVERIARADPGLRHRD